MASVALKNVSKRWGATAAVDGVTFTVEKGDLVALLGPSGCGKSTTLRLIAGLEEISAGAIEIGGRDVSGEPPSGRGIAMVFQNYALFPHLSVAENIAFGLKVRKVPRAERDGRLARAADILGLSGLMDRKPSQLSGGQQQRVALARCIVYNPSIILMDEPLGALDKKLREQMQLELKRIHTDLGITMLYVTHDQEEALTMSDRIVLLNEGRIEQMGAPDELYFKPRSVFAADFLGDSNLMEATIKDAGAQCTATIASGHVIRTNGSPIAVAGAKVKIMMRPENVNVMREGDDGSRFDNHASGTAIDSIILGGVIKHYVRLKDDVTIVAQELTRSGRRALTPGQEVRLAWRHDDTLVLPLEGRVPA